MTSAKQSPRIEKDGSLRWYEGDTFSLTFNFSLKDVNGDTVGIKPTDRIVFQFKDEKNVIQEFESTGTASPVLELTQEISNKFKEGRYFLEARFNSENVTTLLKGNMVVVE